MPVTLDVCVQSGGDGFVDDLVPPQEVNQSELAAGEGQRLLGHINVRTLQSACQTREDTALQDLRRVHLVKWRTRHDDSCHHTNGPHLLLRVASRPRAQQPLEEWPSDRRHVRYELTSTANEFFVVGPGGIDPMRAPQRHEARHTVAREFLLLFLLLQSRVRSFKKQRVHQTLFNVLDRVAQELSEAVSMVVHVVGDNLRRGFLHSKRLSARRDGFHVLDAQCCGVSKCPCKVKPLGGAAFVDSAHNVETRAGCAEVLEAQRVH
ncbi:hypothetical protein GQ600_19035 [Phytophthora cactorum]|nr:hypothetical protein GQ600_19035 [Phytophthora cactorum]